MRVGNGPDGLENCAEAPDQAYLWFIAGGRRRASMYVHQAMAAQDRPLTTIKDPGDQDALGDGA